MTIFTLAEVEERSTIDRPLFILKDKVYDLTDFVDSHPGGNILLDYHGKDISNIFFSDEIHSHSDSAVSILSDFYIGKLFSSSNSDSNEEKIRSFIDISKPIVYQVWKMNIRKEDYLRQVHIPRHHHELVPFFETPFLEIFTWNPWWLIPGWTIPSSIACFHGALSFFSAEKTISLFIFGYFLWFLMEYCLHRFLFHIDKYLPDNRVAISIHFLFHGVHHFLPMERYHFTL
jgi:4-hydroxysphinganine ceramide fatty acyl 2-hydroxylase